MKYVIGNWKSNKTIDEAKNWIEEVRKANLPDNPNLEVVLCPVFTHLFLFRSEYPKMKLGVQTLSPYPDGTYTGAVSARLLKGLVEYAIVGHSERREYFGVTDQIVAKKVVQALEYNITPVVSVDKNNWGSQLSQFNSEQMEKIIVMYEPPEAISEPVGSIGEGEAADVEEVVKMVSMIRDETNPKSVIYGGSVKSDNIQEYLGREEIDGVLPGSASLDAGEWVKMVRLASQIS